MKSQNPGTDINRSRAFVAEMKQDVFYHGTSHLFDHFDLSHVLEGDGKIKFGYGVYVTSSFDSAVTYAAKQRNAKAYYVYTVEVPPKKDSNYIAFKQAVEPSIIRRSELMLGSPIPASARFDGKTFRKYLAMSLTGGVDLEGEKAASAFLSEIGVDFIEWPHSWVKPDGLKNRAVLRDTDVKIIKIEQIRIVNKGKRKVVEPGSVQVIFERI